VIGERVTGDSRTPICPTEGESSQKNKILTLCSTEIAKKFQRKMRTALKERQKTRDVAAYRHPRISRGLYCSAFERFLRSFRATRFFTTNTQGSAKPPPWAKFLYASGVLNIPVFLSLPTSPESFRGQHSLFNGLLTNHFGCRYAALCSFAAIFFRTGGAVSPQKCFR